MNVERRQAIKSALRRLLFAAPLILLAYPVLSFVTFKKKVSRTVVFHPEDLAAPVVFKEGVFLLKGDRGPLALSARCTHLGCTLNYDVGRERFACPCHGSVFDLKGRRIAGPARKDLPILPFTSGEDGSIAVTVRE